VSGFGAGDKLLTAKKFVKSEPVGSRMRQGVVADIDRRMTSLVLEFLPHPKPLMFSHFRDANAGGDPSPPAPRQEQSVSQCRAGRSRSL
jgi:hypothetical protein